MRVLRQVHLLASFGPAAVMIWATWYTGAYQDQSGTRWGLYVGYLLVSLGLGLGFNGLLLPCFARRRRFFLAAFSSGCLQIYLQLLLLGVVSGWDQFISRPTALVLLWPVGFTIWFYFLVVPAGVLYTVCLGRLLRSLDQRRDYLPEVV